MGLRSPGEEMFGVARLDSPRSFQLSTASQFAWASTIVDKHPRRAHNRATLIQSIESQHYANVMANRISGIPLPHRWTPEELLAHFKTVDQREPIRSVRKRLDTATAKMVEARNQLVPIRKGTALLAQGAQRLRTELRQIQSRTQLMADQLWRQMSWTTSCSLRGDLPASIVVTLDRAYAWELAADSVLSDVLVPRTRRELRQSKSRREVDELGRRYRRQVDGLASIQDRVVNARERVMILVDAWNSDTIDAVYVSKAWSASRVPADELSRRVEDLALAIQVLRRTVGASLTSDEAAVPFAIVPELLPFARDMFAAQIGEAVS